MPARKKTTYGAIHVTATPPGWKGTMKDIRAMHIARGFNGVGYNEIIWPDGRSEITERGANGAGAHIAGFNSIAYGLALVGGVKANGKGDASTITAAQWTTLARRMREISKQYPGIAWAGHRDFSPDKNGNGIIEPYEYLKECPCFDAIPYATGLGLKGANIKGTWKVGAPVAGAPVVAYIGPDTRNAYLQRLLDKAGYKLGPIDGLVGPKTTAATKAYQKANALPVTGKFDAATVKSLRTRFEATPAPKPAIPTPAVPATLMMTKPVLGNAQADVARETAALKPQAFIGGLLAGIGGRIAKGAIEGALQGVLTDKANDRGTSLEQRDVKPIAEAAAPEIADALRTEVEALKRYAENKEPWYQSFLVVGGLGGYITVMGAAITAVSDGYQHPAEWEVVAAALGATVGLGFQLYGRYFKRKPIGE